MLAVLSLLPIAAYDVVVRLKQRPEEIRTIRPVDLISIAAILAATVVVRYVISWPELLADPGTVQGRVGGLNTLFGGLRPYLRLLLPPSDWHRIWPLTHALAATAALTPALLFLAGRALGLGAPAALLGALVFLCWPVPTVLFNSDFLQGAVLTFTWLGYALIALAAGLRSPRALAAGMLLLGVLVWARIETLLVLAPAAYMGLRALSSLRRSRLVVVALVLASLSVAARMLVLRACSSASSLDSVGVGRLASLVAELWTESSYVLPSFVLLGVASFVVSSIARRRHGVIWAGLIVGLIPASANSSGAFELPRYAALALPWMSLAAGLGLIELADGLARALHRGCGAPVLKVRVALIALTLAWPLWAIWGQRAYLGQRYVTSVNDLAFREALEHVPPECGVIIPTIDNDDVEMDIRPRVTYTSVLELEAPERPAIRAWAGSSDMAPALARGEWRPRPHGWEREGRLLEERAAKIPCWTFFWGWTCEAEQQFGETGFHHERSGCEALARGLDLEPIWRKPASIRSHRLFTRPNVTEGPLVRPDFEFVLYRVRGLRQGRSAR